MKTRRPAPGPVAIAALAALAALAAAGCAPLDRTAAPLPQRLALPAQFAAAGAAGPSAAAAAAEPEQAFWRGFRDAELDALVAEAVGANPDLRIAAATLARARALAGAAEAARGPTLDVTAAATRARALDGGVARTGNLFSTGLQAAWEPDLFGRNRALADAAVADARASAAQLRAVQVSVAADVARAYFDLRGAQELRLLAASALETQQAVLALVEARLAGGRATRFDLERARVLVNSTAASLPSIDADIERATLRLAVLAGRAPTAAPAALREPRPLPSLPATALERIGTPERLLQRRPDVAAAEARLQAALARAGAARAELFPSVRLLGALGLNGTRTGDLGNSSSFFWNLGASLAWSAFDGGARRAQLEAARAVGDQELASYERTVLAALEDAEAALVAYTRTQQRVERLQLAAVAAEQAGELARARFAAGSSDFLAVLDAERERLTARERLVQAQTGAATSLVAVYRALAGGWGEGPVAVPGA